MGKVISFEEYEAEKYFKKFAHLYDAYLDLVDDLEFSEINIYKHTNIQDIKLLKPATKKNLIHCYNAYNHMHGKYPKSYPRDDVWGLFALAHFQDLKKVSKLTPKEKVELIKKEQCRNLKIDKKEFFGGSMTITSLGGIGGSFFTPIINFPEVAILGIGRSVKKQISINGKFHERTLLPLSLSYDHRIIDGAEAARFNNDLKENLGKNFAYKLAI